MSDVSSESPQTKAEILNLRYNEYVACLEYHRNAGTETTEARNEITTRFENFRQALNDHVNEILIDELKDSALVKTKDDIQEVLDSVDSRIKTLAGTTQKVYKEVRDKVRDVYSAYLEQFELVSSKSLHELQSLSDNKILSLIDRLADHTPSELENILKDAKEELEITVDLVRDLRLKNKNLEDQLASLLAEDDERGRVEVTVRQLEKEVEEGRKVVVNLTAKIEESAKTVSRLQDELIKVNRELAAKSKTLAHATLAHSKLETRFQALENEHAELRAVKEKIESKFRNNEFHLQSEHNRLQEEHQSLADELLREKVKVTNNAKTISGLKDELTIAQLEITQATQKFIKLQNQVANLPSSDSTEPASLAVEIKDAISDTFAAKTRNLEKEVERLTSELSSAQRVVTSCEITAFSQIRELAQQKDLYQKEVANNQRTAGQAAAKIQQLTDQVVQLERDISILNNDSSSSSSSDDDNMASTELSKKLGELFSREDKKLISVYRGPSDDTDPDSDILGWFKEAERVGNNNDWDDAQRLRFFSDRLKSEAMDWHIEYMNNLKNEGKTPTYADWKQDMIIRFRDESDIERLRSQLRELRQTSDQRVRSFVAKINSLYDQANGRTVKVPTNVNTNTPEGKKLMELYESNKSLRDEEKKKILMRGLLPKIKDDIWARLPKTPSFDDVCEAAYTAESVVINKELGEDKSINAVLAGMSLHESQQDAVIANQSNEISHLKAQVSNLQTVTQDRMEPTNLVAAVTWEPRAPANQIPRQQENHNSNYVPNARPTTPTNGWRNNRARSSSGPRFNSRVYNNQNSQPQYNRERRVSFDSATQEQRESNGPNRGRGGRARPAPNRICYNCGKRGHLSRECWQPQQPREAQREREMQVKQALYQRREQRAAYQNAQPRN